MTRGFLCAAPYRRFLKKIAEFVQVDALLVPDLKLFIEYKLDEFMALDGIAFIALYRILDWFLRELIFEHGRPGDLSIQKNG